MVLSVMMNSTSRAGYRKRAKEYPTSAAVSTAPKVETIATKVEFQVQVAQDTILLDTPSWFVGANIPGKKRTFLMYAGGSPAYRKKCDEVAEQGYDGFVLE